MAISVVRLGSPRAKDEGLRIGTVRRPPRGVPKSTFADEDWYDVWFPTLSPSAATVELGHHAGTPALLEKFFRAYRAEMAAPDARHAIALVAALSHRMDLSVGCYCEDESRCHRRVLRELLAKAGAAFARERA